MGRRAKVIRMGGRGGSELLVAYLCNHETALWGWPVREGVNMVCFLRRHKSGALMNLLIAA